jgi:predicted dinucleotide-binding enzyme
VAAHARCADRAGFVTLPAVKVAVIGSGTVGGGLADLWTAAGHEVTTFGREGGDATGSDAVLLAVRAAQIGDALAGVQGIARTPVIDAANVPTGGRPEGFASLAEYVRSLTGGPVAKAFNANYASLYGRLGEARVAPSMLYAADEGARAVTEELIRAAGYEPVLTGGLETARALEDFVGLLFAIRDTGTGPVWYRIAPPESF